MVNPDYNFWVAEGCTRRRRFVQYLVAHLDDTVLLCGGDSPANAAAAGRTRANNPDSKAKELALKRIAVALFSIDEDQIVRERCVPEIEKYWKKLESELST